MDDAHKKEPCPKCGKECEQYIGFRKAHIVVTRAFHTCWSEVCPVPSDHEYRSDYLKEIKNLTRHKGPSHSTVMQDKKALAEGRQAKLESKAVVAQHQDILDKDKDVCLAK